MLRARDIRSPIVCSAAETMFDSGAFATTMPLRVAAATSTLSTPLPARPCVGGDFIPPGSRAPDHLQQGSRGDPVRRLLRGRANDQRVVAADDLVERRLLVHVDVEPRPQKLDARLGNRLPDEDPVPGRLRRPRLLVLAGSVG